AKVRRGMAGTAAPGELPGLLECPTLLAYPHSQQAALFPSLYRALALLNATTLASGTLPESLRLDDLLLRLVGLLLGPLPSENPPLRCGRAAEERPDRQQFNDSQGGRSAGIGAEGQRDGGHGL
ncbi:MAG: hypothetical protein ACK5YO_07200, partial [Planctomyces sp.]